MPPLDDTLILNLCRAVADLFRAATVELTAGPVLRAAVRALAAARPAAVPPRALTVAAPFAAALPQIASPALRPIAAAMDDAQHLFHWRQNPNYGRGNLGDAFMAGYGYVEFLGPKDSLCPADAVRIGLLVLGPGLHYPPHAHPAEEVYTPLTAGSWRRGAEAWRLVSPGVAIHHPSMIEHETKADRGTLLALYCWIGDTATEARLAPTVVSGDVR